MEEKGIVQERGSKSKRDSRWNGYEEDEKGYRPSKREDDKERNEWRGQNQRNNEQARPSNSRGATKSKKWEDEDKSFLQDLVAQVKKAVMEELNLKPQRR